MSMRGCQPLLPFELPLEGDLPEACTSQQHGMELGKWHQYKVYNTRVRSVRNGTAQLSSAQHSTAQHSTAQHSTAHKHSRYLDGSLQVGGGGATLHGKGRGLGWVLLLQYG